MFFFSPKDPSWAPHGYINDKGIIWPFVYKAWRMPTSRKTIRHNWPISSGNNTIHTSNRADDGHRRVETLQEQNTVLSLFFPQTICTISFTPLSFVSMYSYRNQWFPRTHYYLTFFQFSVIHAGTVAKKVLLESRRSEISTPAPLIWSIQGHWAPWAFEEKTS